MTQKSHSWSYIWRKTINITFYNLISYIKVTMHAA